MPGIALIIIVMINITSGMQLSRLVARLYRAQVRLVKYAYTVWVCMSCPTGLRLPVPRRGGANQGLAHPAWCCLLSLGAVSKQALILNNCSGIYEGIDEGINNKPRQEKEKANTG